MTPTYNSKLVTVSFRSALLSGFADGSFIKADASEEDWSLVIGADGEGARGKNNNRSGRVTLTLLATSASNDVLNSFRREDLLTGQGKGPLVVKDLSGRTLAFAADAWIVGAPSVEFGREVSDREWVFESANLDLSIGGNNI